MLFQHRPASIHDLPALGRFLPEAQFGCARDVVQSHWERWLRRGAMSIGLIESIEADRPASMVGAGLAAWITDEAAAKLQQEHPDAGSVRLYRAESGGEQWVLDSPQVASAHARCSLNLWIVHFWPEPDPSRPDFAAFFVQADASFRELHDGFGVGRFFQEIAAQHVPMMQAAGMRIVRQPGVSNPRALAMLMRDDARAAPGSLMSFLFLKPPGQLGLKPAEQRMLTLALRQRTDADIAAGMGCSREYIRKLWSRVYDALHASAALAPAGGSGLPTSQRGREKRRPGAGVLSRTSGGTAPGPAAVVASSHRR